MSQDFGSLLDERMKAIARAVVQETLNAYAAHLPESNDPSAKLRDQLILIKAKEHVTVKEAALLLSCSESHIRKLVTLARKGKTRRPIPYVDMEGVMVFPRDILLGWASPTTQLQVVTNEAA